MAPPNDDGRPSETTMPHSRAGIAVPRIEFLVQKEAGAVASRTVTLDGDSLRIGSHPSNDLVLDDPKVSRFHCRIDRHEGGWRVVDLGSRNGTRVGGVPVRDADLVFPASLLEVGASVVRIGELGGGALQEIADGVSCGSLYGQSAVMRRMFRVIRRVAKTDCNVLVEGETGTGKELVASELVQHSTRRNKPLMIVDCGAIPPNLIESELFGHAKGSFTGAHQARVGAFEAANGGTVFLDEIGELPIDMQPKLLRALAQREVRRMGENHTRPIDVRVIAATNRQLEREINHGRFREDLYFRLAVVTLRVPPLRERSEDISLLVDSFLSQSNTTAMRHVFTPELLAEMATHPWPGNVRELRNFVERRVIGELAGLEGELSPPLLRRAVASGAEDAIDLEVPYKTAKDALVSSFEKRYFAALIAWADGNVSKAARRAGLDRMHVHRVLQRHGVGRGIDDEGE